MSRIAPFRTGQTGLTVSKQLAIVNRLQRIDFGPFDFDNGGADVTPFPIFGAVQVDWIIHAVTYWFQEASNATEGNQGTLILGAAEEGDTLDPDGIMAHTLPANTAAAIYAHKAVRGEEMAGAEAAARKKFKSWDRGNLPVIDSGELLFIGTTRHSTGTTGIIRGSIWVAPDDQVGRPIP